VECKEHADAPHAAVDHAAAPPSSTMNSRRLNMSKSSFAWRIEIEDYLLQLDPISSNTR
jgi:hypothetical protein